MSLLLIFISIIVLAFVFFLAHKYSHKKLIITILCVASLVFAWSQYRHFYKVNDQEFTVWKTKNGCYIMPYKYWGITLPKENYISISNLGSLTIFVNDSSTLLIFKDRNYSDQERYIKCNLHEYNYQLFTPIEYPQMENGDSIPVDIINDYFNEDSLLQAKRNICINTFPSISIDARDMAIYTKEHSGYIYWEDMNKSLQENILNSPATHKIAVDFYLGSFIISDNDSTIKLLNKITSKNSHSQENIFYFYVFNKICLKSDGALSEMLGAYCLKFILNNPELTLSYFKRNPEIEKLYAMFIGYELYFKEEETSDIEYNYEEFKNAIEIKTKNVPNYKETLLTFYNDIELVMKNMN